MLGPIIKHSLTEKKQRLSYVFTHKDYGLVGLTTRYFAGNDQAEYLIDESPINGKIIRTANKDLLKDVQNPNEFLCSLFEFSRSCKLKNHLAGFDFPEDKRNFPKILGRLEAKTSVLGIFQKEEFIQFGAVHSVYDISIIELEGERKKFSNVISVKIKNLDFLKSQFFPLAGLMLCDQDKNLVGFVFGMHGDLLMIAPIYSVMLEYDLNFITLHDIETHDKTVESNLRGYSKNTNIHKSFMLPIKKKQVRKKKESRPKDAFTRLVESA